MFSAAPLRRSSVDIDNAALASLSMPGYNQHMKTGGLIYFIQMGDSGPVKIGYAKDATNLARRIHALQIGSVEPLFLRGVVRGSQRDEIAIHDELIGDRLRGEWFQVSEGVEAWLDKCEHVDGVGVKKRRLHEGRLHPEDAAKLWGDDGLTMVEALARMQGWSAHLALKHFGKRPKAKFKPGHRWTEDNASAAAARSWEGRRKPRTSRTKALRIWRDKANYRTVRDALAHPDMEGWSVNDCYRKDGGLGPRYKPEEGRGGRKPKPKNT